jgi:hypothetical protein
MRFETGAKNIAGSTSISFSRKDVSRARKKLNTESIGYFEGFGNRTCVACHTRSVAAADLETTWLRWLPQAGLYRALPCPGPLLLVAAISAKAHGIRTIRGSDRLEGS